MFALVLNMPLVPREIFFWREKFWTFSVHNTSHKKTTPPAEKFHFSSPYPVKFSLFVSSNFVQQKIGTHQIAFLILFLISKTALLAQIVLIIKDLQCVLLLHEMTTSYKSVRRLKMNWNVTISISKNFCCWNFKKFWTMTFNM